MRTLILIPMVILTLTLGMLIPISSQAAEGAYAMTPLSPEADDRGALDNLAPRVEWLAVRVHPREAVMDDLPAVSSGGSWRPNAPVFGGPVTAGTNVVALVKGDDPDGDPLTFRFHWTVNGARRAESGPVLTLDKLGHGDVLQVSVVASDGLLESAPFTSPRIPVENGAPSITSLPGAPGDDGVFRYTPTAADPEGDRILRFALVEAPAGMELSPVTGEITWEPGFDQVGRHPVEITVEDSIGASGSQRFDLFIE